MIHVCFGLHDATGRYSKFTGTAMLSLFDNTTSPVTVHILHDNTLTADNRNKFVYLAEQYDQRVKFYNVEILCADRIAELLQAMPNIPNLPQSIATCYRFIIPELFPTEEKIIYLDSDIIVNLDIAELWQIELDDAPLAAVPEVKSYVPTDYWHYLCRKGFVKREDFFNAGVLLMNLTRLRTESKALAEGLRFNAEHPDCDGNDQAVLNYCFATQAVKLPQKFNVLVEYARDNNDFVTVNRICHYITSSRGRGFGLNTDDAFNRLWLRYFMCTPWFDEDTVGRLYNRVRQMHVDLKNSLAQLSAMMSGKTRAFFAVPNDVNTIRQIFYVRPDEEIIPAEGQASFQKLINAMNASRGKKIFFICVPNFPLGILTQLGFVAGKDFVNGLDFLSEAHGVPLNPYPLIQAM